MAAVQDQSALDLANSLTEAEIPFKLRCAVCNKLAVNAYKLPCCDQSICESCQASLPDACPVCAHSPLDVSTCKQNKSLRLTIKAFLKSEEKKRNKESAEAQVAIPITPAVSETPKTSAVAEPTVQQDEGAGVDTGGPQRSEIGEDAKAGAPMESDIIQSVEHAPEASTQNGNDAEFQDAQAGADNGTATSAQNDNDAVLADQDEMQQGDGLSVQENDLPEQQVTGGDNHDSDQQQHQQQQQQQGAQNWNANTGFNPMMPMNGGFGGFNPMMGMPAMAMNPMNMQFGGFGGMGMNDMSGMNMGMGFGGNFGGWNGQQGMGNFGAGYYPQGGYNQHQMHQMQNQHFPNRNFQNRFRGQGQNRPYGRGRGGFGGRGGGYNQYQGHGQGYEQMNNGPSGFIQANGGLHDNQGQRPETTRRTSQALSTDVQSHERQSATNECGPSAVESGNRTVASANEDPEQHGEDPAFGTTDQNMQDVNEDGHDQRDNANVSQDEVDGDATVERNDLEQGDAQMDHKDYANQSHHKQDAYDQGENYGTYHQPVDSSGLEQPGEFRRPGTNMSYQDQQQFAGRGRGGFGRGAHRGRGGHHPYGTPAAPPVEPPINAPTGPKAMREGLPNNGRFSRPGHALPTEASNMQLEDNAHSPIGEHTTRDRTRSPSTSTTRDRKRRHRDRSYSTSSQEREAKERRRERRLRHERKYEDDYGDTDRSSKKIRSRPESAERDYERKHHRHDKEKHSSRSHRDSSRESRRHRHRSKSPRESDRYDNGHEEAGSDRAHRKSRSRRDRDRDYDRDRDDEDKDHKRGKERERERDRGKDKDRKRSHRPKSRSPVADDLARRIESSRRSRHTRDERGTKENADKDGDASMGPPPDDVGFKIKGSRSAAIKAPPTPTVASDFAPPTGPKKDRDPPTARRASTHSHSKPDSISTTSVDHYALEREARHRERVLKEKQRRESATLGKRGREDFDPPTGPRAEKDGDGGRKRGEGGGGKSRRVSYKYEDEDGEDRTARGERERERERWS